MRPAISRSGSASSSPSSSSDPRRDFVNKVLVPPSNDIRYFALGIDVNEKTMEWGEVQRQHYAVSTARWERQAADDGNRKLASQLANFGGWLRRTSAGMTVKAMALNHAVARALNDGIGLSVVGRFDDELDQLLFEIDNGFTRGAPERWQSLLRNYFMISTQSSPITMIDTWTDDHPFVRTFIDEQRGDYIRLKPTLRKRFTFVDSQGSVAVRIADQVASLLRRRYIDDLSTPYLNRMKEREVAPALAILELDPSAAVAADDQVANLFATFGELDPPSSALS